MPTRISLAIFVGGQSRRMGTPKGKLQAPGTDSTIVEALAARGRAAGIEPFLVGDARAYADLLPGVTRVPDDPPGAGPLAGLCAALRHARDRSASHVIAVGCDMPYVTPDVLGVLARANSKASIVAPRRGPGAPWEPMLARYEVESVLPSLERALEEGYRSFQELFEDQPPTEMIASEKILRALRDWDTPEDVVG